MHYCGMIQISEITIKEISEKSHHPVPVPKIWRLDLVKELLDIRDNNYDLDGWKTEEIIDYIQCLCTTSFCISLYVNHFTRLYYIYIYIYMCVY